MWNRMTVAQPDIGWNTTIEYEDAQLTPHLALVFQGFRLSDSSAEECSTIQVSGVAPCYRYVVGNGYAQSCDSIELLLGDVLEWVCSPLYLRWPGWCFLHGSMVSMDDRAVLVCGATGAGKTTLVALLVCEGATYWSDDVIACRSDGLAFAPFPRPLCIRDRQWIDLCFPVTNAWRDHGLSVCTLSNDGRSRESRQLLFARLQGEGVFCGENVEIVFLDRREEDTPVREVPLSKQEAFIRLLQNMRDPYNMAQNRYVAAALSRNYRVSVVQYSSSIDACRHLMRFLSSSGMCSRLLGGMGR